MPVVLASLRSVVLFVLLLYHSLSFLLPKLHCYGMEKLISEKSAEICITYAGNETAAEGGEKRRSRTKIQSARTATGKVLGGEENGGRAQENMEEN